MAESLLVDGIWRGVRDLAPGDIIELGVVVYDVLAVTEERGSVAVAIRQRRRERRYEARIFKETDSVRLCSPLEGIAYGDTVAAFERRRLMAELEAIRDA